MYEMSHVGTLQHKKKIQRLNTIFQSEIQSNKLVDLSILKPQDKFNVQNEPFLAWLNNKENFIVQALLLSMKSNVPNELVKYI